MKDRIRLRGAWAWGVVLVFGMAAAGTAAPQAAPASARAGYADDYPDYHSRWVSAVEQGTNAFFEVLAAPSPRVRDQDRMTESRLRDLYIQSGLMPWITFLRKDATDARVVPGGKLHLSVRGTFSSVMGDRERMASITDFAVQPTMPFLFGEESAGWMPGRTKQGNPVINGWIDQSVWLRVPEDAEPGNQPFEVYLMTYGSQDGTLRKQQQKQRHAVQIVTPPVPTREHVLCAWAYGMDQGKWLATAGDASSTLRGLRTRQLLWVDDLLRQFENEPSLATLVAGLRKHPGYVDSVLKRIDEAREES